MDASKDIDKKSLSPIDNLTVINDINEVIDNNIINIDKESVVESPSINFKVKDDLIDIIDSIVYEVSETKTMTVVNSGLDRVIEYLNDNGLSTEELLEIIDVRRDASLLNLLDTIRMRNHAILNL